MLTNKYNIKDLGKVKTIIGWQIIRDIAASTMKIDQSAFVKDFVIKKNSQIALPNIIPIKTGSAMKMSDPKDYNEIDLQKY